MLKVFRDNLKNLAWVLWLVIAVFILLVFVDFGGTVNRGGSPTAAAATVGRDQISFGEFERSFRQAESFYRQAYGDQYTPEFARQIGLQRQVLEQLVNDRILLQEAKRMGIEVTDEEVRKEILQLPVFTNENGGFVGQDIYLRTLRNADYTAESFEESIRQDMLSTRVRSVLSDNIWVTDEEVERSYRDQIETAKVRFVKLSGQQYRASVVVTDDEAAAYFADNQEDFRIEEKRAVEFLVVDRAELQNTIELADEEIGRYYQENLDSFTSEEQVRARHILVQVNEERTAEAAQAAVNAARARIEAGEDFAAVAAEVSEDPGSKERGGDLGLFGRGRMVPEFETPAFAADPGTLVGPVTTPFGVHLIEVLEKKEAGVESLEAARPRIEAILLAERARTAAENKAQELAARIESEKIASSEAFAAMAEDEAGVSYDTRPAFGLDDNVAGIGRSSAFSVAAFDLEEGTISDPVKIGQGWAIVRVSAIEPSRVPELTEVRDEVVDAIRDERQVDAAVAALRETIGAPEAGEAAKSLDDVASELGVEIEESADFGRGGSIGSLGRSPKLIAAALELDEGALSEPLPHADGAVLLEVVSRTRFDPAEFEAQRAETREQLVTERFNEVLSTLIAERRESMNVSYAPELLESLSAPATGS